jgi:uncharacterized protein (DUF2235 family)
MTLTPLLLRGGNELTRRIIVLADGTGNSASKPFRTNVWRLYQAMDLATVEQIAWYSDGVGTSQLKLLALFGGAFGWGLKRNLIDLYVFLCRNYRDDDEIFAFGFSRGAFTVRVLIQFILAEGLVSEFSSQDDLRRKAKYAYRRFRTPRKTYTHIEGLGRIIRDLAVRAWTLLTELDCPKAPTIRRVSMVKFIGVWDTVDAYGLPVSSLKKGIDKFLWPLALEDVELHPSIEKACHALAIDDKRAAFRPLLWNESCELFDSTHTDGERLTQMWFSGVHANIGGGYPDDNLSFIPLIWMIDEAQKKGLRFQPLVLDQIRASCSPNARMYESHSGLGAYYRYDPRHLDPASDYQGARIAAPKIHWTAISRMAIGPDAYAPVSLPEKLRICVDGDAADVIKEVAPESHANILEFGEFIGLLAKSADSRWNFSNLERPSV